MDCTDLRTSVENSWGFLFTDYAFKVLSCQEGTRESVLLCAESQMARVRFVSVNYDDDFDIDFGTTQAPLDWSPNSDVTTNEHPEWYSLRGLLVYLEKEPLSVEELVKNAKEVYENRNTTHAHTPQIKVLAQRAKPFMPRILSLFTKDGFHAFRAEYSKHKLQQRNEFNTQWDALTKHKS